MAELVAAKVEIATNFALTSHNIPAALDAAIMTPVTTMAPVTALKATSGLVNARDQCLSMSVKPTDSHLNNIMHSAMESLCSPNGFAGECATKASSDIAASFDDNKAAAGAVTVRKRPNYLSWPDYFMAVAFLSAQRSKDPSTQVGACIVNSDNKIVGIGYNGMPIGCSDDEMPWCREPPSSSSGWVQEGGAYGGGTSEISGTGWLSTKHPYVCHAELNAVLNKNSADVRGCTIYVALFPCNECAKVIIQSGITRVVYCSDKYGHRDKFIASRRMFTMAGVTLQHYRPTVRQIVVDFDAIEKRDSCSLSCDALASSGSGSSCGSAQ